ncbi:MAG: small multi-drug export protein [Candidatus Pacearchaeota archaeon]
MEKIVIAILLSLLPISELRGGLIYAIASGINPIFAFFICVIANMLVAPALFLFLSTLHNFLYKIKIYRKFFDAYIKTLNKKVEIYERKHRLLGYFALTLFTAIPLPFTGAWTSSFIAWILGLNKKKSIIAINLGVIIAGIIVLLFILGIFNFLNFLIKAK